ncbi:MAG: hypothetical protein K6F05_05545, partial [Succinivibrio sp.]|nr:hypothetical protein [Succinivibrio sp.]
MKKFVTLLCGVMAAILLSACQNNAEPPKAAEPVKALVVYYSLTGHTEAMAQTIAADVKGDLFRLEVVNAYPKQQKQREKRIKKEFTGKLPALKALPKVADYDVIFIGYPVWYSKLPPALTSFLKKSKLADKKVAFFCTSGSSPISVT